MCSIVPVLTILRSLLGSVLVVGVLAMSLDARALAQPQDPLAPETGRSEAAERFREMTAPEKVESERQKRARPPFEFFRAQVPPSDVSPYMKANHWVTIIVEMQSNQQDYLGDLRTVPVDLRDMPHAVSYQREARLLQEQTTSLSFQGLFPRLPRERTELPIELLRPQGIRADGTTAAYLQRLSPHQMLVPVLGPNAARYADWNRFQCSIPVLRDIDQQAIERLRYYRFIHAQDADKPLPLSPHPLAWTSISHLIWDGLNPDLLNLAQQQSLVDWLHWGGQLIVVAGAEASLPLLQESFLAPYLPASYSGASVQLTQDQLQPLYAAFPAPLWPRGVDDVLYRYVEEFKADPERTDPRAATTSLYVTGLNLAEGAEPLEFQEVTKQPLGAERRVGRGRLLLLAFDPTDKALQKWPGLDTFVRDVILRRPLDSVPGTFSQVLDARSTSWLRYTARDVGAKGVPLESADVPATPGEVEPPTAPVAAWLDDAILPSLAQVKLDAASGIKIPSRTFILRVLLAYVVALVPVNWLVCRFLARKRELAWVLTPLLALGFAAGVERAAAYDLGYDLACDEIDLLEIQPGYDRGHLTRFASLYANGRVSYDLVFPDNPATVALPMSMGASRYQRGVEVARSVWQSYPEPALLGLPVQPRSLAMFRAESMVSLPGTFRFEVKSDGQRVITNLTGLTLNDVSVVDVGSRERFKLGHLAPGESAGLGESWAVDLPVEEQEAKSAEAGEKEVQSWLDPASFLGEVERFDFDRPEDEDEWRLIAWTEDAHPGLVLRPAVDRTRGIRFLVAHLDYGGLPSRAKEPPPPPSPPPPPARPPEYRPSPSSTFRGNLPGALPTAPAPSRYSDFSRQPESP